MINLSTYCEVYLATLPAISNFLKEWLGEGGGTSDSILQACLAGEAGWIEGRRLLKRRDHREGSNRLHCGIYTLNTQLSWKAFFLGNSLLKESKFLGGSTSNFSANKFDFYPNIHRDIYVRKKEIVGNVFFYLFIDAYNKKQKLSMRK